MVKIKVWTNTCVCVYIYMTDIQNVSQILISKENLRQNTINMTQDQFLLTTAKTIIKIYHHGPFLRQISPRHVKQNPLKILQGIV